MKNKTDAGDIEARLRESERINQLLLDATQDVAFLVDRDGRILGANAAFAAFTGLPVAQVLGNIIYELQRHEATDWRRAQVALVLATGLPVHGEDELDGVAFEHSFYPVLNDKGEATKVAVFARDVTARKQAEQARQEHIRLLARANEELRQRHREVLLLNRMTEFLQLCRSCEETWGVVAEVAAEIFDGDPGALFTFQDDGKSLEAAVVWGDEPPRERSFHHEDCWAQRRGRPHLVPDTQTGLLCRHVQPRATLHGSVCLPLQVQGESLGVLHHLPRPCATPESWDACLEQRRQLTLNVANSISLALSGLQLRKRLRMLSG